MIKTDFIMKTNRRLRVRVRVTFIIFYFELAPTDLWCNMLQTLLGRTKYEEEMSDEQPCKVRTSYNDSKPTHELHCTKCVLLWIIIEQNCNDGTDVWKNSP